MNESETLAAFLRSGAILTNGHFRYASGRHGSVYLNKDAIYPDTKLTSRFCKAIAERFEDSDIEAVAGPALGGIILAQWTAYHLSNFTGRTVEAVYAEKQGESLVLRRGYRARVSGKRVLAVEDILTTGRSARLLVETIREAGGHVAGLAALCSRGNMDWRSVGKPVRFTVLAKLPAESWEADECPLCKAEVPFTEYFGHS